MVYSEGRKHFSLHLYRGVQLLHCRNSMAQRLENMQQAKTLKHFLIQDIFGKHDHLSQQDIKLDNFFIQIILWNGWILLIDDFAY